MVCRRGLEAACSCGIQHWLLSQSPINGYPELSSVHPFTYHSISIHSSYVSDLGEDWRYIYDYSVSSDLMCMCSTAIHEKQA